MNTLRKLLEMYNITLDSEFSTKEIKLEHRECSFRITQEPMDYIDDATESELNSKLFEFEFIDNSIGNITIFSLKFSNDFTFVESHVSEVSMNEDDFFDETNEYFEIIMLEFNGA